MSSVAHVPAKHLLSDGPEYDFFQAVRLLERIYPDRLPVGRESAPSAEVVRFRSFASLSFPPSSIYSVEPPMDDRPFPRMIQTFMGLIGPSGVLPRHYTQLLLDLGRDVKGPERRALGDWLALFDHRFVSLFFRAWEKYRFTVPFERGEPWKRQPDAFTSALYSLVGLGTPSVRNRLRISVPVHVEDPHGEQGEITEQVLGRIDDLALLYYGGLLAQKPHNSANLAAMLCDYFGLPISVRQFQGQWLILEAENQTCLGSHGELGVDAVAGDRVWDVQAKFRIRVGPLSLGQFQEFLPDHSPEKARKSLFLLSQLVRLYAGPSLDFDVQLILHGGDVPACQLEDEGFGRRLGWNTWLTDGPLSNDADDTAFAAEEEVFLV